MKIKVVKDLQGEKFILQILLEGFSDDEVYLFSRYGPFTILIPSANLIGASIASRKERLIDIKELPTRKFWFSSREESEQFLQELAKRIKDGIESFASRATTFVGEEMFEISAGEEIKRINTGARKAMDKNSPEYKEVIEKNREAFEKLSKL